jgi:hypothetical protein
MFALFALVAYWWDSRRCYEIVLKYCQRECDQSGVQLLDSTVSRQRLWYRRNENGWLELCRVYVFEYSDDSDLRRHGYVVLLGRRITQIKMPA